MILLMKLQEYFQRHNQDRKNSTDYIAGDIGTAYTSPYEYQRDVTITVTEPVRGQAAENSAKRVSEDIIYYGFDLDKTASENITKRITDYYTLKYIGKTMPGMGNTIGTLRMINDVIGSVKGTKLNTFKKAQEINNLGAILDMFNLYYVASLIREQDADIV